MTTSTSVALIRMKRAFQKLDNSHGRQRARRNARQYALRELKAMRSLIDKKYPTPRAGGTPTVRPEKKYPTCPICNIPAAGWIAMASHLEGKHACGNIVTCVCGKGFAGRRSVARHLSMQKDLRAHIVISRVGRTP